MNCSHIVSVRLPYNTERRMMALCADFVDDVNHHCEFWIRSLCCRCVWMCVYDWRHSRTHSDASAIKPNKQTTLDAMYIPITICSKPDWMIEFHIFIDWFRLISQCFGWFCCILYVLLSVWSACLPLSDCSSARTFYFYVDAIWLYELVWAEL